MQLINTGYESGIFNLIASTINLCFMVDSYTFFIARKSLIFSKLSTFKVNTLIIYWFTSNSILLFKPNFLLLITFYSVNTILLYKITILHRHTSNLRGMGAPGNFLYILNLANLTFALGSLFNKDTVLMLARIFVIEIGIIFLISGIYKYHSGYRSDRGIQIGLYNPMWNVFSFFWKKIPPNHPINLTLNWIGLWGEVIAGALLISVIGNTLGAIIIFVLFIGIGILVRLGTLAPTIIILVFADKLAVLYDTNKNLTSDYYISGESLIAIGLLILFLNIIAYIVMNYNFYAQKSIKPACFQDAVNGYLKFSGLVLWRVFTADLTAIYIEIRNSEKIVSQWRGRTLSRWNCVLESIALVSVFTSLKYSPTEELFMHRLSSYLKTLNEFNNLEIGVYYIVTDDNQLKLKKVMNCKKIGQEFTIYKEPDFELLTMPDKDSRIFANFKVGTYDKKK